MSLEDKAFKIWMSPDEFELVVRLKDAISNRNTALDGRAEVELANLKEIFNQVHDPRLQKLTYKKRFESLANAIANQIMFHEKTARP